MIFTHEMVAAAMRQRCPVCGAVPGHECRNTINAAEKLPGRPVHLGRLHID